jgi:hypothetical protein
MQQETSRKVNPFRPVMREHAVRVKSVLQVAFGPILFPGQQRVGAESHNPIQTAGPGFPAKQ